MDPTLPHQLLDQARQGSSAAFGILLESLRPYLLLLADRQLDARLRAKGGASDLVQETCLAACADRSAFRGHSVEELRHWLEHILQHRLANLNRTFRHTRKRSLQCEVAFSALLAPSLSDPGLIDPHPTPHRVAVHHEELQALQAAFHQLPELPRQILLLRFQQQLSFEEIAHRLNHSVDAVRKQGARAIQRLQHQMRKSLES